MNRNTNHHLCTLVITVLFVIMPAYQATYLPNVEEYTSNSYHIISPVDGPMNSSWPMYCHDPQRTSRSPYAAKGQFGVERWRVQFGDMIIFTSPAIAEDGTIYIGGPDRYLMAINSDGTEKWRLQINGPVDSSPAIGDDGTIYVGANGDTGYLYAVNPNGTVKWRTKLGNGWTAGSPVIDRQGVIYMTCVIPGNICAVYPNGTLKWKYQTNDWVYCDPALNHDESMVYCGSNDHFLYALYTNNGTLYWRYNTDGSIGAAPTVAHDGTIYVGSLNGYLTALQPDGTMMWKTPVGSIGSSSPSLAADGTIYIGNGGDGPCSLKSVNPVDGNINWEYEVDDQILSSPAVDVNGVIYFGSHDGRLYAVNSDGTLRWKFDTGGHVDCAPAIDEHGRIYIRSWVDISRSYFFCLETTDEAAILELGKVVPGFAHVRVPITNSGNLPAEDITWNVKVEEMDFLLMDLDRNGVINKLDAGETRWVFALPIFGIGEIYMEGAVEASNANPDSFRHQYAFVIGPFIVLRPEYC